MEIPRRGDALWAHTANREGARQLLLDHLRAVADLGEEFATGFGHGPLGAAAGALHDIGKADAGFQAYLRQCEANPATRSVGPDHKGAGAVLAEEHGLGALACLIHGHHGGLDDFSSTQAWLAERKQDPTIRSLLADLRSDLVQLVERTDAVVPHLRDPWQAEFLLRMLFSCLVDADSLDTEAHFRPGLGGIRKRGRTDLDSLRRLLDDQTSTFQADSSVNRIRTEVRRLCVKAAVRESGLFRLAVPTGGGKTLSGMSFALHHAQRHGLRRVVVAVPFTSITEQTAHAYRGIFGEDAVLEHHSAVDVKGTDDGESRHDLWARLATENWDAPVVVTTTVQLFESLFSNRRSATRKLHRLARAVIIIDEAQAIPPGVTGPIVQALRFLCRDYGSTVVLSTATQPSATTQDLAWLAEGGDIVPEPVRFFEALRRVRWTISPEDWPPERVARRLADVPQGLAILNTRRFALSVLEQAPTGTLHLSTLLCGAHRRRVLGQARERLRQGEPCRLVSTQVIEAGVDIDFPLVLRALAGIDSILQGAGRCNREGSLPFGDVVVFGGNRPPPGAYRTGADIAARLLASGADMDDLETVRRYFHDLYDLCCTDKYKVRTHQRRLAFRQVAEMFRMIDEDQVSVAIRDDDRAKDLLRSLRRDAGEDPGQARRLMRMLQPYLVALRPREIDKARLRGWIDEDGPIPEWTGPYDDVRGVGELLTDGGDDAEDPGTA